MKFNFHDKIDFIKLYEHYQNIKSEGLMNMIFNPIILN